MSNRLNELVGRLAEEKIRQLQPLKRDPAVVVSVGSDQLRAVVRLGGGSEYKLLNKTGEKLSENDSVWVEYRTVPSSGYIAMRNGEAVPVADTSELEERLEELEEQLDSDTTYSTVEHEVGEWLDGSAVYEKTFVIPDAASGAAVPLYITRLREVIGSVCQRIDGVNSLPFDGYSFTDTQLLADPTAGTLYVTARYTKNDSGAVVVYTWAELAAAMSAGGNIKLGCDITAPEDSYQIYVSSGITTVLDLNGKTLNFGSRETGFYNEGDLTLNDSLGTGVLTGFTGSQGHGSAAIYNDSGSLTINGCTFSGNSAPASSQGGVIGNYRGTVVINDSTFTGNNALVGGAIWNNGGTTTLNNCHITNNTAANAGAILVMRGDVYINGGEVTGNVARGDSSGNKVGGIDIYSGGRLHIKGNVQITNNTAWGNSTDTVPRITSNITVRAAMQIVIDGTIDSGSSIGARHISDRAGVITSGWASFMQGADPADYITSDNTAMTIRTLNGEAALWPV